MAPARERRQQGLVRPGEVSPKDGHVNLGQDPTDSNDRNGKFQTACYRVLVNLEPVANGVAAERKAVSAEDTGQAITPIMQ